MKKLTSWICDVLNQSKTRTLFKCNTSKYADVTFSIAGPYTLVAKTKFYWGFVVDFDGVCVEYDVYKEAALLYLDRLYRAYFEALETYTYPDMKTEVYQLTVRNASNHAFDAMILSSEYSPDTIFSEIVDTNKWSPEFLKLFDAIYITTYLPYSPNGTSYA